MRFDRIYIALIFLPFWGCSQNKPQPNKQDEAPIVIELFTSEGCSSCPPADNLVAKIQKEYYEKSVYILAYHVDYWDRLGWRDPFSNLDYSKRQYKYAHWLKNNGVYTPQIVVNGSVSFVGSDQQKLRAALGKNNSMIENNIVLKVKNLLDNRISVDFTLKDRIPNTMLCVALIQNSATTKVTGGENSDRLLHHVDIVREFNTIQAGDHGLLSFNLPNSTTSKYHCIAFLQNSTTGRIISATSTGVVN
ncbi:hypothetical protein ACVWYG_001616 [Pedobacter sp. UYEF25]